jgi:TolA-binding protein
MNMSMKKTLIIGLTAAMLLSASPAFAKSNGHGENEKKEHGRGNSKSFVVNATTTAQITSIKKQIDDLNKQLQELKRTSRISGQTIRKEEREEGCQGGVFRDQPAAARDGESQRDKAALRQWLRAEVL